MAEEHGSASRVSADRRLLPEMKRRTRDNEAVPCPADPALPRRPPRSACAGTEHTALGSARRRIEPVIGLTGDHRRTEFAVGSAGNRRRFGDARGTREKAIAAEFVDIAVFDQGCRTPQASWPNTRRSRRDTRRDDGALRRNRTRHRLPYRRTPARLASNRGPALRRPLPRRTRG